MFTALRKLDGDLSLIETQVAPGGPIDSSIDSINRSLDSIDKSLDEIQGTYDVTVNYDLTVEQLIQAGKYDWVNDDITYSHFPSTEEGGKAQVVIFLVNFNHAISSEDAIGKMYVQGLRPATLKELLALGAAYPNLQRGHPIVALGSTWRFPGGKLRVPYLSGVGSPRGLGLIWSTDGWLPDWYFAAVRK